MSFRKTAAIAIAIVREAKWSCTDADPNVLYFLGSGEGTRSTTHSLYGPGDYRCRPNLHLGIDRERRIWWAGHLCGIFAKDQIRVLRANVQNPINTFTSPLSATKIFSTIPAFGFTGGNQIPSSR